MLLGAADLDFGVVWYPQPSVFCRQRDLPSSEIPSSHWRSIPVPVILGAGPVSIHTLPRRLGRSILKSPIRYALKAFGAHSRYVTSPFSWTTKPNFSVPLLNFSRPPSVSLIVLIHFWAWLYLLRRASLKGSSHGSSWTMPKICQLGRPQSSKFILPVPSAGILFPPVFPNTELSDC